MSAESIWQQKLVTLQVRILCIKDYVINKVATRRGFELSLMIMDYFALIWPTNSAMMEAGKRGNGTGTTAHPFCLNIISHATSVLKWLICLPSETSAVKQILYAAEHNANPNWGNVQYMMDARGAFIHALAQRNILFDVVTSPSPLFRNTWMADFKLGTYFHLSWVMEGLTIY